MPDSKSQQDADLHLAVEHSPEKHSPEELMPVVYDELRGLARAYLHSERSGHTLQPTALVNEAYLRLINQKRVEWCGRTHFFSIGARMMRRLLVDHARGRGREKRGGDWQKLTLDHELGERIVPLFGIGSGRGELDREDFLTLHDALEKLTVLDERAAQVVEMRFFAGLTMAEIAEALDVSKRTAEGDWTHAKAWLKRELGQKS